MKIFLLLCLAGAPRALAADYEWKPVLMGSVSGGMHVTGRVVPQDGALHVESARVQGRVLTILKREGEPVKEGDAIYAISSGECLSLAEERRVAASKHLGELLEGVAKREAQLGVKLQGDQCLAVAGYAGVLTKRNLDSGATFNVGAALANVLDTKRLTIELDIPERDQAKVHPGQQVHFEFASNPGEHFQSRVETAVPTIDPTTRTSKARLAPSRLPRNLSLEALVFGEVATGGNEATLNVPSAAVVFHHNQQYVVAGGPEHSAAVPVVVVSESDSVTAIRPVKEGSLHEGDLVAVKGAIFLFRKLTDDGHSG